MTLTVLVIIVIITIIIITIKIIIITIKKSSSSKNVVRSSPLVFTAHASYAVQSDVSPVAEPPPISVAFSKASHWMWLGLFYGS